MSLEFSSITRDLPGLHILALHGELDIVSAYDLALVLVEVAGSTVVVDLSDLTFMDSSGISALVMARNRDPGRRTGSAGAYSTGRDRSQGFRDRGAWCVDRGMVAGLG